VALEQFCSFHHIDAGGILIGCDNKGAVHQAQVFHEHVPCRHPHADLLRAITALRLRSNLSLRFIYVPGHQDALIRFEDLPPHQRLNVWADFLAKRELHRIASLPVPILFPPSLHGEKWSAYLHHQKLVSDPRLPVLDSLGAAQAMIYWEQKGQLSLQSFPLVQWETLHTAISAYPPTFQMWLSKFASGHSAVGVTMFRWKKWDSPVCPVCMQHDETISHVLTCPHPSRRVVWIAQVEQLRQWMLQAETAPEIISCLIPTLLNQGTSSFSSHANALCHLAALDQDAIGFFGCMVGRLSLSWNPIQALYYASRCSQRSAKLWAVRLCRQLLQLTHFLWCTRNDQVLMARQRLASQVLQHDIIEQFQFGSLHLLLADLFYVTPGPHGFSQDQVLALSSDDQLIWLQAVRNARIRGQEQLQSSLGRMRQLMENWALPLPPP